MQDGVPREPLNANLIELAAGVVMAKGQFHLKNAETMKWSQTA